MRLSTLVVSTLLVIAPLSAQQASSMKAPAFDVASIKQVAMFSNEWLFAGYLYGGGACGNASMKRSGSRIEITAATLCGVIRAAYDVKDYQVVGIPPGLAKGEPSNFFEIEARAAPDATPTLDEARQMLRTLLAERFQLKAHREPREAPVYALRVAMGGPKMAGHGETSCPVPNMTEFSAAGGLFAGCMPMSKLALELSRRADRPVLDKTGLTGRYAFRLKWFPDGTAVQPDSPPSLFTAIREQLGLTLDPQRAPVDAVVVDHAERPSPN